MSGLVGLGTSPRVKIVIWGASNVVDNPVNNSNQTFPTQALGRFKSGVESISVAIGGIATPFGVSAFDSTVSTQFASTKATNIVLLQFGGSNPGDMTNDPATVMPYYNNLITMSQKWKALGAGAKVICCTTIGYACTDSTMVSNYVNANSMILGNNTDFDAIIDFGSILPSLQPTTGCPIPAITADCNHLTAYGHSFYRDPYITAVNSLF